MARVNSPRRSSGSRNRLVLLSLAGMLIVAVLAAIRAWPLRTPWSDDRGPATGVAPVSRSTCKGTLVSPGDDVQAMLDRGHAGASFCFSAGTYRLAPLRPEGSAAARRQAWRRAQRRQAVAGWQRDGATWSATGYLPARTEGPRRVRPRLRRLPLRRDRVPRQPPALAGRQPDQLAPGRFYEDYGRHRLDRGRPRGSCGRGRPDRGRGHGQGRRGAPRGVRDREVRQPGAGRARCGPWVGTGRSGATTSA